MAESVSQNTANATDVSSGHSLKPKEKNRRKLWFFFFGAGALFIGVAALGVYTRNAWTTQLQQSTNRAAQMVVQITHPEMAVGLTHLQLPRQTLPSTAPPIFAHPRRPLQRRPSATPATRKPPPVLARLRTPRPLPPPAQA